MGQVNKIQRSGETGSNEWTTKRWTILAIVFVVTIGIGIFNILSPNPPTSQQVVFPSALASAVNAESSVWYCTGSGLGPGSPASGSIYLTNSSRHSVSARIVSVSDTGSTASSGVVVAPYAETVAPSTAPSSGSWSADTVYLNGGGVSVSQGIHGGQGWSEAPCVSKSSKQWYFASGSTQNGDSLFVTEFNPTSASEVVDLTFDTSSGSFNPPSFQGIVVGPGSLVAQEINSYVQNDNQISITVAARNGRIVASELQVSSHGGLNGLSISQGASTTHQHWMLPASNDLSGGFERLNIYNPGNSSEMVKVSIGLASGQLAPFTRSLAPESTWQIQTTSQTRIPPNTTFVTNISSSGGQGIVVSRQVASPNIGPAPQYGIESAVGQSSFNISSRHWIIPSPGSSAHPIVANALLYDIALSNASNKTIKFTLFAILGSGWKRIEIGRLPPSTFLALSQQLGQYSSDPLAIDATGPLAAVEDLTPAGAPGVVTMPAIAQS